jgi:class 3 adenylate cyclase
MAPAEGGKTDLPAEPVDEILRAYRSGTMMSPREDPDRYRETVERLVSAGENLMACDLASEGLVEYPGDQRLRQLKAIALSRSGASSRGLELVRELEREGLVDQETVGMLGSISKDLWSRETDPDRRRELLAYSRDSYRRAYDLPDGNYWSGINAAALALVAGDRSLAFELASRVLAECEEVLKETGHGSGSFWPLATMGEASLIRGEWEEAMRWYSEASKAAGDRSGDIASTRRNALLVLGSMDDEGHGEEVLSAISVPTVMVFAGHMIDRPDRSQPRFPPGKEESVREAILERLSGFDQVIGFSSAACGSDILFLEALAETGSEANVVLPFEEDQFLRESVSYAQDGIWVPRFRKALDGARTVTVASPCKTDDVGLAYEYTNMVLLGLARMKKRDLEGDMVAMAVWDGKAGDGFGGTRSNMRRWTRLGLQIERISPGDISPPPDGLRETRLREPVATPESGDFFLKSEVRAVMFADFVGYSRLSESEIVDYVRHFMGSVRKLVDGSSHSPVFSNTWGDGIFMVFRDVKDAGIFALDLCDLVHETDWKFIGFSEDKSLRIALHAGPVQQCEDPITGAPGYFGSHIGRTARIEPITEPGQVYTSEQFAALAECYGISEFRCDYVGRLPLSKGYGAFPTYHLTRRSSGAPGVRA